MTSFDDALKVWAKKYMAQEAKHLDVAEIVDVKVRDVEESGYCETCHDPRHIDIDITYKNSNGELKEYWEYEYYSVYINEFDLLQELFKEG